MEGNSSTQAEDATGSVNEPSTSERSRRSSARRTDGTQISSNDFSCSKCDYISSSRAEKNFHMRQEHSGASSSHGSEKNDSQQKQQPTFEPEQDPVIETFPVSFADRPRRGRPRKSQEILEREAEFMKPRVTTKELISGTRKKKPEALVKAEVKEESSADPRIEALGLSGSESEMSVGDFLQSVQNNQQVPYKHGDEYKEVEEEEPLTVTEEDLDDFMEIGREEEIDEVEEIGSIEEQRRQIAEKVNSYQVNVHLIGERKKKFTGRNGAPRKKGPPKPKVYDSKNIPLRLRVGDVNGKYACYIKECEWKANYRSLRMEHMRVLHPDWVMPSRYLLQRISKDGVYIDPETFTPPIPCLVEGCPWRGNFRASRSSHMRSVHVEYYLNLKNKQMSGSYNSEGTYLCHLPECEWRGSSRSTRAQHMKKEHPNWKSESIKKSVLLECFACNMTTQTTIAMVHHIHAFHGLGLHVDQCFDNKADFLIWLNTVDRMFHCSFVRRMSPRQTPEVTRYYLVCGCEATKNHQFIPNMRAAAYSTSFLKKRTERVVTRRRIDCCLYLEVREEMKTGGKINVSGCLEHTGHRWGSSLMRCSVLDRQLFHEFMTFRNIRKQPMPMLKVLDLLSEIEGFTIDHMNPSDELVLLEPRDINPILSLYKLVCEDEGMKESVFNVDLVIESPASAGETVLIPNPQYSIGYMDESMKKYWSELGPDRNIVVEKTDGELGDDSMTIFYVLVFDQVRLPKCCCIYVTTDVEKGYESVLRQLYEVDPRPPRTILCDPSQVWVDTVEKIWPEMNVEIQIPEYAILDYWAEQAEKMMSSDFDKCFLVCALRRMLRITDMQQFLFFIVELFETLYELGYDYFLKFMDCQLSDVTYYKRWSPFHRSEIGNHGDPTVALSVKYFRDRFLDPCEIERIDQYFMHMSRRTLEFNYCIGSETYTTRPLDPVRTVYYDSVVMNEFGKMTPAPVMINEPQVYQDILVYPEMDGEEMEMEEIYEPDQIGPVVEEEILPIEEEEEVNESGEKVPMMMRIMDMDGQTTISHNNLIENKPPMQSSRMEETEGTSMEYEMYETDEHIEEEPYSDGKGDAVEMNLEEEEAEMEPPAKLMKHETTKAVIGSRRPRNRFRMAHPVDLGISSQVSVEDLASQIIAVDRRRGTRMPPDYLSYNLGMGIGLPEEITTKNEKNVFDPNQPSTSTAIHGDPESDSGSNHIDW